MKGSLEQELVAAAKGRKIELSAAEIRRNGLVPVLRERLADQRNSERPTTNDEGRTTHMTIGVLALQGDFDAHRKRRVLRTVINCHIMNVWP